MKPPIESMARMTVWNDPAPVSTPRNPPVPFGEMVKLVGSGGPLCTRIPGTSVAAGATE